ncbi:diguanylate cyclase domain-containing protein [Actinoplanes sp. URMC 104]|uniref:diguanylate cyclase domain-containing protein n=1 Tax=Actinoplanes sp. URMC 104 TaxID=3423409 RepID=UPI003F19D625
MTASLCLALATPALFVFVTGARPFPQPGDGAHMGFVLLLFAALLSYPLRAAGRRQRWKAALDSATVALGGSMVLWYLAIGPALDRGDASFRLVLAAAAYPMVDLLVLFALARVLLRGAERGARRPLLLLGAGVVALLAGDAYLGYTQAHSGVVERTPWQFACWLTMHLLLACGAVEQCRRPADAAARDEPVRGGLATKLPYLAIGVGYALMAVAAARQGELYPWAGLVAGGVAITGLVVARQMLAQHEIEEAAATDALTGLANRARVHRELGRLLERPGRTAGVLLIDLNGFKPVNDSLGHAAGDRLLVAVADVLRASVRGDDLAGRLGGDEFVVVLDAVSGADEAVAVARRVTEALDSPVVIAETPVRITASIGVAVCETGTLGADAALHRADVAMYHAKRSGSAYEVWKAGERSAARAVGPGGVRRSG